MGQIAFKDFQLDPDPGKVGNGAELFSRIDILALADKGFRDNSGKLAMERNTDRWPVGFLQLFELFIPEAKLAQALIGLAQRHLGVDRKGY